MRAELWGRVHVHGHKPARWSPRHGGRWREGGLGGSRTAGQVTAYHTYHAPGRLEGVRGQPQGKGLSFNTRALGKHGF